jgi:hypothetical protein
LNKKYLTQKISELEAKSEIVVLSPVEKQTKFECERKQKNTVSEEEIKFRQIAREKHIREGECFHLKAKGKKENKNPFSDGNHTGGK